MIGLEFRSKNLNQSTIASVLSSYHFADYVRTLSAIYEQENSVMAIILDISCLQFIILPYNKRNFQRYYKKNQKLLTNSNDWLIIIEYAA